MSKPDVALDPHVGGDGSGRGNTLFRAHPKLSAMHLVGLTFFAVCGGDYGIEDVNA